MLPVNVFLVLKRLREIRIKETQNDSLHYAFDIKHA